ncbi:uncharacterized protein LOC9650247 isoform X2 [Selaginella moellendorffii]|uniref:uncharacterized protein LOC9650247 isoform X2 n=1 Tax=Selaginella moellendorffii TaxID=88036 RepID=UPI000D1C9F0C|nr:uncharacterized protein LOC9650247 isoform X2 [Selaginella moellendorffii]|eukprot:XP_024521568.1 uncharacterized protein LOC9650247 isoform X2 [Selaginella moellendorffii]
MCSETRRNFCICAAAADSSQASESSSGEEIDRLIDKLRSTDSQLIVAENVLAFDSKFWLRLATRTDLCKSEDDEVDLEELASNIMQLVERIVQKTEEKIETSTDVLMAILEPVAGSKNEEIVWPPRDPDALQRVRKELMHRESAGYLDDGFLAEVNAQLRQAKKDADKPGLLALLQKVLQLYAATFLAKTSYAKRDGVVDEAEELLENIISADSEAWDSMIRSGVDLGGGPVKSVDLRKMAKKRIERILLRTEGGSYKQRILVEYLKEIERSVDMVVAAFSS